MCNVRCTIIHKLSIGHLHCILYHIIDSYVDDDDDDDGGGGGGDGGDDDTSIVNTEHTTWQ